MIHDEPAERTEEPRRVGEIFEEPGHGLKKAIKAVKEAVPVETYAVTVTALRFAGSSLRGPCPIHKGDNPEAFAVWPGEGRWHCFRCNEGGDVIDLCRAVEGGELWEAVVSLATRYGVELPRRSKRWHERQGHKARVREAAARQLASVYQRRLTRVYAPMVVHEGQTPEEELRALEELALALAPVARHWAERRVCGA